jgi:hypothetical protein
MEVVCGWFGGDSFEAVLRGAGGLKMLLPW